MVNSKKSAPKRDGDVFFRQIPAKISQMKTDKNRIKEPEFRLQLASNQGLLPACRLALSPPLRPWRPVVNCGLFHFSFCLLHRSFDSVQIVLWPSPPSRSSRENHLHF